LQNLNPWSFFRGAQFGLINVEGRTEDPEQEQEILDKVGSYGKQLGRLGDALAVVIEVLKLEDHKGLTAEQKECLKSLTDQVKEISHVKNEFKAGPRRHGWPF